MCAAAGTPRFVFGVHHVGFGEVERKCKNMTATEKFGGGTQTAGLLSVSLCLSLVAAGGNRREPVEMASYIHFV